MKKKLVSFLLATVMVVSLTGFSGLSVQAKEEATIPAGNAISVAETEIADETTAGKDFVCDFQEDTLSRLYQLKVEALGAELFPESEYVQATDTMAISTMAVGTGSVDLGTVVYSETKPVSDTEELTYVEFSTERRALVYHKTWSNIKTSTAVSGGTKYTSTLVVTVSGCYGSIYASGFTYTINPYSFDWIDSVGTCHDNFNMATGYVEKAQEDATPASARIAGNVQDMKFGLTVGVDFQVRVGGNAARVYVAGIEI